MKVFSFHCGVMLWSLASHPQCCWQSHVESKCVQSLVWNKTNVLLCQVNYSYFIKLAWSHYVLCSLTCSISFSDSLLSWKHIISCFKWIYLRSLVLKCWCTHAILHLDHGVFVSYWKINYFGFTFSRDNTEKHYWNKTFTKNTIQTFKTWFWSASNGNCYNHLKIAFIGLSVQRVRCAS